MKKVFAIILAALMLASLAGIFASCSDEKTITVGYTLFAPMNYKDGDKLVGFDTELAEKVFSDLGYKVVFKEIKWDAKYTDLESGNIDCLWNGFTSNATEDDGKSRSEKVDFSYNYMTNKQAVVVKKGSGIASAENLAGKKCGVEAGSAGESYANDKFKGATIKKVDAQVDAILEVNTGSVDFAVVDVLLAKNYCGKGDYKDLEVVDALSSAEADYYAVGFKKGSELTAKVNEKFEAYAKDGSLVELAKKYGIQEYLISDFSDQKK